MSKKVRERLKELGILNQTTHEDRLEIDREVERETGLDCDEGMEKMTRGDFVELVARVLRRRGKKLRIPAGVV